MKKIMILVFISSLFLIPGRSYALSCVEPPPPDVAFDKYDAVLIGSVEKIESGKTVKILTIEVEKSFKGVDEKTITISEDLTWGESQENATYLFFLNREGKKWVHPLCSPTTHNTNIAEETFADKEEVTLQAVESTGSESTDTALKVLIAVLLVIAASGVLIKSIKAGKNG